MRYDTTNYPFLCVRLFLFSLVIFACSSEESLDFRSDRTSRNENSSAGAAAVIAEESADFAVNVKEGPSSSSGSVTKANKEKAAMTAKPAQSEFAVETFASYAQRCAAAGIVIPSKINGGPWGLHIPNAGTQLTSVLYNIDLGVDSSSDRFAQRAALFGWTHPSSRSICYHLPRTGAKVHGHGLICFNPDTCSACAFEVIFRKSWGEELTEPWQKYQQRLATGTGFDVPEYAHAENYGMAFPGSRASGFILYDQIEQNKCSRCHLNGTITTTDSIFDAGDPGIATFNHERFKQGLRDIPRECRKRGGVNWITPPGFEFDPPCVGANCRIPASELPTGCDSCHSSGLLKPQTPEQKTDYCETVLRGILNKLYGAMAKYMLESMKDDPQACTQFATRMGCKAETICPPLKTTIHVRCQKTRDHVDPSRDGTIFVTAPQTSSLPIAVCRAPDNGTVMEHVVEVDAGTELQIETSGRCVASSTDLEEVCGWDQDDLPFSPDTRCRPKNGKALRAWGSKMAIDLHLDLPKRGPANLINRYCIGSGPTTTSTTRPPTTTSTTRPSSTTVSTTTTRPPTTTSTTTRPPSTTVSTTRPPSTTVSFTTSTTRPSSTTVSTTTSTTRPVFTTTSTTRPLTTTTRSTLPLTTRPTTTTTTTTLPPAPTPPPVQAIRFFRAKNPTTGARFHTTSRGEAENVFRLGWINESDLAKVCVISKQPTIAAVAPINRLYNPNAGLHFYTTNSVEALNVALSGWRWERGVAVPGDNRAVPGRSEEAWIAYQNVGQTFAGQILKPVYRFYSMERGYHLYTSDPSEVELLKGERNFHSQSEYQSYRFHPGLQYPLAEREFSAVLNQTNQDMAKQKIRSVWRFEAVLGYGPLNCTESVP